MPPTREARSPAAGSDNLVAAFVGQRRPTNSVQDHPSPRGPWHHDRSRSLPFAHSGAEVALRLARDQQGKHARPFSTKVPKLEEHFIRREVIGKKHHRRAGSSMCPHEVSRAPSANTRSGQVALKAVERLRADGNDRHVNRLGGHVSSFGSSKLDAAAIAVQKRDSNPETRRLRRNSSETLTRSGVAGLAHTPRPYVKLTSRGCCSPHRPRQKVISALGEPAGENRSDPHPTTRRSRRSFRVGLGFAPPNAAAGSASR